MEGINCCIQLLAEQGQLVANITTVKNSAD